MFLLQEIVLLLKKCLVAMKKACKQVLELAAEKAEINSTETSDDSSGFIFEVDKQSILNTINQVK